MGRPLAAAFAGVPPLAGVALNKLVPKLNAPPAAAAPLLLLPAVCVLDALPVFAELPLPDPKANGAGVVAAPNANGGGWAAGAVVVVGSDMPNGLTGLVGTGILLVMLPNVGFVLVVVLEPKANGVGALVPFAGPVGLALLNANGVVDVFVGLGCCGWAGDEAAPNANGVDAPPDVAAPNEVGEAMLDEAAPKLNGLGADGFVEDDVALVVFPKKLVEAGEAAAEPNVDAAVGLATGVPNGDGEAVPNDAMLEPNAEAVPKEGVAVVVDAPNAGVVVVVPPNGPEVVSNDGALVVEPNEGGAPKEDEPNADAAVVAAGAPNDGCADVDPKVVFIDPNEGVAVGLLAVVVDPKTGGDADPNADEAVVVVVGAPKNDVAEAAVEPNTGATEDVVVNGVGAGAGVGLNVNPPGFGAAAVVVREMLKEPKASEEEVVEGVALVEEPKMLEGAPKLDDVDERVVAGAPNADAVPKDGAGRTVDDVVVDPNTGAAT